MKKPMKKLLSILFIAALFCTMVTWPSRPVEASAYSDIIDQISKAASGSEITIYLGSGTHYFNDEIFINEPITINFIGQPGTTIAGNKLNPYAHMLGNRAFKIMSDNVHLNFTNITFNPNCMSLGDNGGVIYIAGNDVSINGGIYKNNECGREKGGGAICISNESGKGKNVTIENGQFENIHYNSVGYSAEKGGAIYVAGGCNNATIKNCNFTGFAATEDGGAIYLDADGATIENCKFKQCRAREDDGGFIYVNGANATIKKCEFDQSEAYDYGGAIYVNKNNATIEDCSFNNCKASTEEGGAIYTNGEGGIIKNCTFKDCTANDQGGAIYANKKATIENCAFQDCKALKWEGGAIYIYGDNSAIEKCSFNNCQALDQDAGAIFVKASDVNIKNCVFENCKANGSGHDGGAIKLSYDTGYRRLTVEGCKFTGCWAQGDGHNVDGAKSTTIKHCSGPYEEDYYYNCTLPPSSFECTDASLTEIDNDKPNCTEDGIKPYYQCVCGNLFSDSNPSISNRIPDLAAWLRSPDAVAPALGHKFDFSVSGDTLTVTCRNNSSHNVSLTLMENGGTYPGNIEKNPEDVVSGNISHLDWQGLEGMGLDYTLWYYTSYTDETNYTKTTPENSGAKAEGFPPKNAGNYMLVLVPTENNVPIPGKTLKKNFTISQKPITSQMITLDPVSVKANGSEQTVTVKVMDGTYELTADDCTVGGTTSSSIVGTHTVTVTGKGNYTTAPGSVSLTWSIINADPLELKAGSLSASPITYGDSLTLSNITPNGCVIMSGTTNVTAIGGGGTFAWEDSGIVPDKAGQATYNVVYTPEGGPGTYGILKIPVTIDVLQKDISGSVTVNTPNTYNGNELKDYITVVDKTSGVPYVKGTDYDVAGPATVKDPGDYTATINFKGNYKGTVNQPFKVTRHIKEEDLTFIVDKYYEGEDAGDAITIMLDGTKPLTRKVDYEMTGTLISSKAPLEYSYPATITFSGKYEGTISKTFVVEYPELGPRPAPDSTPTPEPAPEPAPYYPSTPSNPQSTPTPAPAPSGGKIDGGQGSGSTKIDVVTKDETATIPEISATTISNVAKNTEGELIRIDVSGTGKNRKKISRVTIPKKTVENVVMVLNSPANDKDRLIIVFDTASISADARALSSIAAQAKGENIQFVVEAMNQTGLNNSQKSIVDGFNNSPGKNVVQVFQAYVESNGVRVPDFEGGIITVGMVDYKIPVGKNERNFHIYYLPTEGKREHCVTWVENKTLYFGTGHFSEYAIVYDETMLNGPGNEVHRLLDTGSGDHLFTISKAERDAAEKSGWKYEGVAFIAIEEGKEVYRLRYPQTGRHVYTASEKERDALVAMGWTLEGTAFLSYGETEVYRLLNPVGMHMFTINEKEKSALVAAGWIYEGVGFKVN